LALVNLAGGMRPVGAPLEWEVARSLVGAVVPVLLLIGLAHVETLFRERARVKREQELRHCELEQGLDRRTEELAEAKEEFHQELSRQDQEQRAFAERAQQERVELGVQIAAGAGRHLNRHAAVIELYAKLLLARQSEPGTTLYHERLAAEAAETRALGRRLLACGCCQPPRAQLLSLGDIVRHHMPTLQILLGEHRLLVCTCAAESPLVWADPQMVRWMLEELVRNARDAMAEGGCVLITVERANLNPPHPGQAPGARQLVSVVVTDTGHGIGHEIQKHVGEPFFTTNPGKRAGLGLASVSGLIKAHGGWLAVTGAPERGTRVRLCFPSAMACPVGTAAPVGLSPSNGNRL
jgi:signal transduction histidine kinase